MPSAQFNSISAPAKTVVVIPTYNEAENLPALIAELRALAVPDLSVLIVDDNSPDGTGRVADALAERLPGTITVRHRAAKEGLGRAYIDGFSQALAMGADFILQMDADFSHPLSAIPTMLNSIVPTTTWSSARAISAGGSWMSIGVGGGAF